MPAPAIVTIFGPSGRILTMTRADLRCGVVVEPEKRLRGDDAAYPRLRPLLIRARSTGRWKAEHSLHALGVAQAA